MAQKNSEGIITITVDSAEYQLFLCAEKVTCFVRLFWFS